MIEAKLKDTLRLMIRQYGFERVDRSLREIGCSEHRLESSEQCKMSPDKGKATKPAKRMARVTAAEYVAKMELSPEKSPEVVELAKRFQDKSFLPTFGDVRNFCQVYGIDEPASKSRASAIPRVFKFIAAMGTDDVHRILDDGMFSGAVASRSYRGRNPAQRQGRLSHPRKPTQLTRTLGSVSGFRQT